MRPAVMIAAGTLLGAAALLAWYAQQGSDAETTAGDDESNIFSDAIDSVKSSFNNWPVGSEPYQSTIQAAATQDGVPISLLAWLLWKESRYNPAIIDGTKRSRVGATGIAQFMPERISGVSEAVALNPFKAIPAAADMLARLYRRFGTWGDALAAYNWGEGNVNAWRRTGLGARGQPMPPETIDYSSVILARAGMETVG